MTPAETMAKMQDVVNKIIKFEKLVDDNSPMEVVLPFIYGKYKDRYKDYTIRKLCQEMHDFYKERNVSLLQKRLFLKEFLPKVAMNVQEAKFEYIRGHGELIYLKDAEGRIALEGALPYPPGIICVMPGERWSETAKNYFEALQDAINKFPGFSQKIQAVCLEKESNGLLLAECYVLKKEFDKFNIK